MHEDRRYHRAQFFSHVSIAILNFALVLALGFLLYRFVDLLPNLGLTLSRTFYVPILVLFFMAFFFWRGLRAAKQARLSRRGSQDEDWP